MSSSGISSDYGYTTCAYNNVNYLICYPRYKGDLFYIYKIDDSGNLSLYASKRYDSSSNFARADSVYCSGTNIYFVGISYSSSTSFFYRKNDYNQRYTYYASLESFFASDVFTATNVTSSTWSYYYISSVYEGYLYELYQKNDGGSIALCVTNLSDKSATYHSEFLPSSSQYFYNFQRVGSFCYWTCDNNGTSSGVFIAALNLSTLEVTYTRIDGLVSSCSTAMIAESNDSFLFFNGRPIKYNIASNTYYIATVSTNSYSVTSQKLSAHAVRFGSYILAGSYKIQYTSFLPSRLYSEAEYQAALAAGTCDQTHVTDTNNDGYDDSSYTAGYNSGLTNAPKTPSLSYRDGKLFWTRTDEDNPVALEYMTYSDWAGSDDNATWTQYNQGIGVTYNYADTDYWYVDEYDFAWERSHNNKWVQFRLVETTVSGDIYSNIIQIDVCLTSHVTDTNNDGYDDSSYTAGYNAGGGACSLIHVVDNDNDTYDDASFTAGKQAGITYQKNVTTDSGVADFVTKILGAFTGSALYVGSNISIGGITLLTIVGIIAIGGAVIIVLKVLKGG